MPFLPPNQQRQSTEGDSDSVCLMCPDSDSKSQTDIVQVSTFYAVAATDSGCNSSTVPQHQNFKGDALLTRPVKLG